MPTSAMLITMGAGTAVTGALFFARPVGRFLLAIADAADTFRASWTEKAPAAARTTKASAKTPAVMLDPIQRDVVSALVNLGRGRKQAEATVMAVGTAADFETLFRQCSQSYPVNQKAAV